MNDDCASCGDLLDVTKRIYHVPGGRSLCAFCKIAIETQQEILRVTNMVIALAILERDRRLDS